MDKACWKKDESRTRSGFKKRRRDDLICMLHPLSTLASYVTG